MRTTSTAPTRRLTPPRFLKPTINAPDTQTHASLTNGPLGTDVHRLVAPPAPLRHTYASPLQNEYVLTNATLQSFPTLHFPLRSRAPHRPTLRPPFLRASRHILTAFRLPLRSCGRRPTTSRTHNLAGPGWKRMGATPDPKARSPIHPTAWLAAEQTSVRQSQLPALICLQVFELPYTAWRTRATKLHAGTVYTHLPRSSLVPLLHAHAHADSAPVCEPSRSVPPSTDWSPSPGLATLNSGGKSQSISDGFSRRTPKSEHTWTIPSAEQWSPDTIS
ncbi:hypothetical protein C8Q80DRAFT_573847 [Daedaleopsis nitida]|nr:hypothetical protein C8Q80DRAFT_573847 [Daedaleopsis nitida]